MSDSSDATDPPSGSGSSLLKRCEGVFNGAQQVPYKLPGSKLVSAWKSDSNSNIILFDDDDSVNIYPKPTNTKPPKEDEDDEE